MTINDKVKILIEDLKDSQHTRTQNFNTLVESDNKKIISYCALGALGCVKRLIYHDDEKSMTVMPDNASIIQAYGIDNELTKTVIVPMLYKRDKDQEIHVRRLFYLTDLIITCNDSGHFSFEEIAAYLHELLIDNLFKECSRDVELRALENQRKLNDKEIKAKYTKMPDL